MSDEDDNVPYRQTEAYRRACVNAEWENLMQKWGARVMESHSSDPWNIPEINVIHDEVNSPLHPFSDFTYKSLWRDWDSDE